jgi:hypothetical protein
VLEEVGRIGEQVVTVGGGGGGGMGIRGAGGGGGRGEEEEGGGAHLETPRGSGRRAHGERPERGGERLWTVPGFLSVLAPRERAGCLAGLPSAECRVPSAEERWWE